MGEHDLIGDFSARAPGLRFERRPGVSGSGTFVSVDDQARESQEGWGERSGGGARSRSSNSRSGIWPGGRCRGRSGAAERDSPLDLAYDGWSAAALAAKGAIGTRRQSERGEATMETTEDDARFSVWRRTGGVDVVTGHPRRCGSRSTFDCDCRARKMAFRFQIQIKVPQSRAGDRALPRGRCGLLVLGKVIAGSVMVEASTWTWPARARASVTCVDSLHSSSAKSP